MAGWTHSCCGDCWFVRFPEKSQAGPPARALAKDGDPEGQRDTCCYCGESTVAGIYLRADPTKTPCKGEGARHL